MVSSNRFFSLHTLLLVLVALLATVAAAAGPRFLRTETSRVTPSTNHATSSEVNPINTEEDKDLTALVFTVTPIGFEPEELTVPAGHYLLVVQNRSGRRDLTFRFDRENGERLNEVRQERLDSKRQFDLQPGSYFLSEAGHPEWRCVIRVTAR